MTSYTRGGNENLIATHKPSIKLIAFLILLRDSSDFTDNLFFGWLGIYALEYIMFYNLTLPC